MLSALVPVMTNDRKFPAEDDRTRIGPQAKFPSPDSTMRPAPLPDNDSDKTRISPGINIGGPAPTPPAAAGPDSSSHPPFADEQTRIMRPSGPVVPPPEDELVFEAKTAAGPVEKLLTSGRRLTVGRDPSQDITLDDRTLSREHLVLERRGDKVVVQVLGLNGLVHNGVSHKSATLEMTAPASFTVGGILCRLRRKDDADATLFMADPAQFAGAGQQQPTPPGGDSRPPAPPPFPGGDFTGAVPASQPAPAPVFSPSGGSAFDDFSGQSSWEDPFSQPTGSARKSRASSGKAGITRYLLIGGAALLVVLLVAALVFFFTRIKDEPRKTPPSAQQAPAPTSAAVAAPAAPAQTDADPKNYNQHGTSFNEAYRYYNEGKYTMACDFLQDIPATSAFRERAENLARQMGNCTLND
ncbi:MAG: FHA domain-containing protein [Desulfobacteraceae bacterium]|nr:MAG: FHA domain-containing protein [Desulfobacteraceae bacterium]